jgi:23S rRNA pseudoU1915 N3-methylase RlmH
MRLRIIWTGKTRDARLRALIDDYAERLSHFARCEVTELREPGRTDKSGIDKETKRISDRLRPGSVTVLLDAEGVEWTSQQLAAQMQSWEAGLKKSRLSSAGLTVWQAISKHVQTSVGHCRA